jgi:uncharacterized membrane protein YqjE
MDEPPVPGPARPADIIDSKSESRPQGSNRLDATQPPDAPPGDRTARDATGPAPGLREQFGATKEAALGLVKAHVELARAEFADILDEIKRVALLVGLAFAALITVSLLLPIGLSLFIGETLFGSLGWGVLHGTLLLLGAATAAILVALGAGGRVGLDFLIGALSGLAVGLLLGLNLTNRLWTSIGTSFASTIGADIRPLIVGALVCAIVLGLLGLIAGARGGGFIGAFVGAVGGAIFGALLGALTSVALGPRVGAAIGLTVALIIWPIAMSIGVARRGVDSEALKNRFWPDETIETTKETIEWVRERTPLGPRS